MIKRIDFRGIIPVEVTTGFITFGKYDGSGWYFVMRLTLKDRMKRIPDPFSHSDVNCYCHKWLRVWKPKKIVFESIEVPSRSFCYEDSSIA